jgi:hypothetical protein
MVRPVPLNPYRTRLAAGVRISAYHVEVSELREEALLGVAWVAAHTAPADADGACRPTSAPGLATCCTVRSRRNAAHRVAAQRATLQRRATCCNKARHVAAQRSTLQRGGLLQQVLALRGDRAYTFRVRAANAHGLGPMSEVG